MKNALILFLAIAMLFCAAPFAQAVNHYGCTGLTGGTTGKLDAIDITGAGSPNANNLAEGDSAIVTVISGTDVTMYWYLYDASGTAAEESPNVIRPDDYASAGNWLLTKKKSKAFVLSALSSEPSGYETGDFYVADNDNWDPCSYAGTNDYMVMRTSTGWLLVRDMVTGEAFFSSWKMQNDTDPDISEEAQISHDTDGANETSDASLRGHDGSNQFAWARKLKCINATIPTPNDYADALRDKMIIWSNETGMTYTVTKIEAWADTDDSALNVEEYDGDGISNNATIDAINCTTGSGPYTDTETTITGATVEASHVIALDFDDTDDPGWVKITICGWLNANVD
jgi:hypothetical protein